MSGIVIMTVIIIPLRAGHLAPGSEAATAIISSSTSLIPPDVLLMLQCEQAAARY